ncbi:Transmembrane protein [Quillaja saponaria]|uniref:Transmembrane protein n=1 Tax=Quillaja saponaria TaxID=32244 RepID=A0AAD7QCI3_QUISA|nr:Transmembrane protein [Quillaja saponaria]
MSCFRSKPSFLLLFVFSLFLFVLSTTVNSHRHHLRIPDGVGIVGKRHYSEEIPWKTRRSLADETVANSSLVLAKERTHRRDPFDNFKRYTGGWNISNSHYWASVAFTAAPFFVIAAVWFVLFGLCLSLICLCYCCCPREPYGYSRIAYALSLILLILFTLSAIAGSIVLYTGQGKFHRSSSNTLGYVVSQADITAENLRNVSDYLAAAKRIGVDAVFLPPNVQKSIDDIQTKINSSAANLSSKAEKNSKDIQDVLDSVGLALIIIAAVMLFLAFLGFLFSVLGLQCLVYTLVIFGWILVAGTFILCGVFLLLHNGVADTCVAMDEWVQNPTAHTSLDDILPCVDNATAQETLLRTKEVTNQLVNVVDTIISNISNRNFPPNAGPLYFNQSGPLMPVLCNPFHSDLTDRQCVAGEVGLDKAIKVWKNYTCQVSATGKCSTPGRITPTFYNQMSAAVNVSYGLYRYGPFLVNLEDCTFVRDTFTDISNTYCPGLRRYTQWIYVGLVLVSAAVMFSLIFWVIYARERRHRVYTKQFMTRSAGDEDKAT